jgi:hypothetical protein
MSRKTYAEHLTEIGREELLPGPFRCACNRHVMAADLFDVTVYDDLDGDFRCTVCVSQKDREELLVLEAQIEWPTEENMNDLRAVRDQLLLRSDWSQLPDNQTRLTDAEKASWSAYRASVRQVVPDAKLGVRTPFPPQPN